MTRSTPAHIALLLASLTFAAAAQTPTLIAIHGNIFTGAHLQPGDPSPTPARVTAIAIAGEQVLAVGSDADILKRKGPATEVLDLHGAFAMPGFNDAHTHIAAAGQQRLTVDLTNVPSLAAMQAKIAAYAATLAPGTWLKGGGWDHTKWPARTLPTRADLDKVTGNHPAILERTDGHIAVVNSAALAAAGITGKTVAPQGSHIDLDPTGQPTGILREDAAMKLVYAHVPRPDAATRRRALQLSIDDALAHGVTTVQDFSDWDDFLVLETMERDGKLPLRISEWLTFNDPLDTLIAHRAQHDQRDPYLHTGFLKGFMDGSLGSRTAALAAPYSDDPENSGLPRYDQQTLNAMAAERSAAGFQLGFHAIGDRANTMALDAFTAARSQTAAKNLSSFAAGGGSASPSIAPPASRDRIEHAQVLLPSDFDRFAALGIIASMQPSHLLTDMAWAGDRLGPDRARYAYAWRSFLDHHVVLAFGTDYPVESISPFRGLYAALTRQNEAGTQTFHPEQRLTLDEALFAYTQASAFADFREHERGRLEPGYLADFIVLDRDLTRSSPREILHTTVLRTVVGGKTRFLADSRP